MNKVTTLIYCCILFTTTHVFAENRDPIVLVHGFSGWGREELGGFKYWGAFSDENDIQEKLRKTGQPVFTAAVGPFSSVWDRAIELYYQIKGGCVDYGLTHSKRYKHKQKGRCYKGFYPEWSENNKIHLIGHSMGGPTVRALAQILSEGSREEFSDINSSELYKGNHKWVRSVTTVSSPNNSATLAGTEELKDYGRQLLLGAGALIGATDSVKQVYNAKLDQWGLVQGSSETYERYIKRVFKSPLWNEERDFSVFDLGPEGTVRLNAWVKTQPDIYYFAILNRASESTLFGDEIPRYDMNPLMIIPSLILGKITEDPGYFDVDFPQMNWKQNDGVCNTISMGAPSGEKKIKLKSQINSKKDNIKILQPGIWYEKPLYEGWDHMDMIGHCVDCDATGIYKDHLQILQNLE